MGYNENAKIEDIVTIDFHTKSGHDKIMMFILLKILLMISWLWGNSGNGDTH